MVAAAAAVVVVVFLEAVDIVEVGVKLNSSFAQCLSQV